MPFNRPTLSDLISQILTDFQTRFSLIGAILRRSVLGVIARAQAGVVHLLFGYLDYISKQCFPDTADSPNLYRYGSIYKLSPIPAAFATGTVTFTGTDGVDIPMGTLFQRTDATEYKTTEDATPSSGTVTVAVQAIIAALSGDCDSGTSFSLTNGIAGINSAALAATDISGGADKETDSAFLSRLIDRIANPPQGGVANDYVQWAKTIAGVTRAWAYGDYYGFGTVGVFFVRDNDVSIFPDSGEIATVQAYIDTVIPMPATATVAAPTNNAMAVSVHLIPSNASTQAAVTAELQDLIFREGAPGASILLSHIREAISNSVGVVDYTLATPSANFTSAAGQLPTLGTVTFT